MRHYQFIVNKGWFAGHLHLLISRRMGATCFVQPLDLVKNRMQVMKVSSGAQKPSSASVLLGVVRNEGVFTLYNGLSAGLLRQATYTTTRLGT